MKALKTTLIRGGTAVSSQEVSQQDVLIQGEKITAKGDLSDTKVDTVIDAEELLVLPGTVPYRANLPFVQFLLCLFYAAFTTVCLCDGRSIIFLSRMAGSSGS